MDTSFTDYLSRTRIERSIELLRDTDMSLLEIAGLVGFEDQSYFTKVFKKETGLSPKKYRDSRGARPPAAPAPRGPKESAKS